jgi:hypothetical protein
MSDSAVWARDLGHSNEDFRQEQYVLLALCVHEYAHGYENTQESDYGHVSELIDLMLHSHLPLFLTS